ncbi:MAG: FGGY-family carbohydrate kinase [Clostridia bacterium]|nr:FGGY-family carbohydrate kinase [Clostridia bacterium]
MTAKELILNGRAVLGIEFGSTRIKAVLIDENNSPVASGAYDWENSFSDNIWTYSLDEIYAGLKGSYASLKKNVQEQYGVTVKSFRAIGISGMMHGYMPFDKDENLLVPFRTWRNTITGEAASKLSDLFSFNIPQRWSIAHLYKAILSEEPHVKDITFFTTLAGFIHWKLTGKKVLGVGEASGMFPIDDNTRKFNIGMIEKFNALPEVQKFSWKLENILPEVLSAGENAGTLTKEGALLLDEDGDLEAGIPMCPPEGDAGTGMVATNSVGVRTGNVSAGTSVFAMIVLEKMLSKRYEEIDLVTTPAGDAVAMVHCNNCTSDINAWANLFKEFADTMGITLNMGDIFTALFKKSEEADADLGNILSYNYFSGEHITGFESGRPLLMREPDSNFSLANFMRVQLFTCFGALRTGLDILKRENVAIDKILGHGGFFKTPLVGQNVLSAVMDTPVSVMETAGEGGAWGIAVLASYMVNKDEKSLAEFLDSDVFASQKMITSTADDSLKQSFNDFMLRYTKGLKVERAAVEM